MRNFGLIAVKSLDLLPSVFRANSYTANVFRFRTRLPHFALFRSHGCSLGQ
jgi:hypothetical protein